MNIKINGKPLITKVKPKYKTFELISCPSVRNYNTYLLGKLMASFYQPNNERISFLTENALVELRDTYKVNFKIFLKKDSINFYLIVPNERALEFERKIASVWEGQVTIHEVDELPQLDPSKCVCAELGLKEHDVFSLDVDSKETSAPLSGILSTVKILENNDDIALLDILLEPYNPLEWRYEAKEAHNKLNKGIIPTSKVKFIGFIFDLLNSIRIGLLSLTRVNKKEEKELQQMIKEESSHQEAALVKEQMTKATKRKQNEEVISTLIRVATQSENKERATAATYTLSNALKDISGDNEIEAIRVPSGWNVKFINNIENKRFSSIRFKRDKLSIHEVGKLLQLPGRELILEHPQINANQFKELDLPEELSRENIKTIELGTVTQKGIKKPYRIPLEAYDSIPQNAVNDANCITTIIQGGQGTGKTSTGELYCMDFLKAGNSVILTDTADGEVINEFINALPLDYPEEKIHVLDMDNRAWPIALNWNDVYGRIFAEGDEELTALEITEKITSRFLSFLNELSSTGELSDRMLQFITSCLRAISTKNNWSFLDLELSLTSPAYREELLCRPEVKLMPEVVRDLEILQAKTLEGKESQIVDPILSRVRILSNSQLLANLFFQEPKFNNEGKPMLDIRKLIDNEEGGYGHLIAIKASYDTWQEYQSLILSFFDDKINFNIFSRVDIPQAKRKPVLKWLDEPHKVIKAIEKRLVGTAVEFRKYRCKQLFSCHSISQMGIAKEALLNGGSQIISFKTDNIEEFKRYSHIFEPYGDHQLLYAALPEKYRAIVTTRLPSGINCPAFLVDMKAPPKFIKDRSSLWLECSKRYGRNWREVMGDIQRKRLMYQRLDDEWYDSKSPKSKKRAS